MYKDYCECCKRETPHDDIFDFDRIFSHCLICGYLTLDHVCDDDELERVYSSQEENEENEYQCCDDEIEF